MHGCLFFLHYPVKKVDPAGDHGMGVYNFHYPWATSHPSIIKMVPRKRNFNNFISSTSSLVCVHCIFIIR